MYADAADPRRYGGPDRGIQTTIRKTLSAEPLYVVSDGQKLYRVYQNLIENALKYSLEGSRIFIDAFGDDRTVTTIIKNTSSYEMNFDEETITERFAREMSTGRQRAMGSVWRSSKALWKPAAENSILILTGIFSKRSSHFRGIFRMKRKKKPRSFRNFRP